MSSGGVAVGCVRIVGRGMVGEVGGTLMRVSIVVVIVEAMGERIWEVLVDCWSCEW